MASFGEHYYWKDIGKEKNNTQRKSLRSRIIQVTRSNMKLFQENTKLKLWHVLLTLGFVKGTQGYV
jgi:hypothetical protein